MEEALFGPFVVIAGYSLQHNRNNIQYDQNNDEYVDELVPSLIAQYFGVQQAVSAVLGGFVHVSILFDKCTGC